MRAMPSPGGFDNRPDRGELGSPAKQLVSQPGIGNKFRRIARTPRSDDLGDRAAGYFASSLDHFAHAVAAACAEIHLEGRARLQLLESCQMCRRQVFDMDVVADARSIGSRIIAAEDRNPFALAE